MADGGTGRDGDDHAARNGATPTPESVTSDADGPATGDGADAGRGDDPDGASSDPRGLGTAGGGLGDTPPDRGPRELTDRRAVAAGVLVIVVGGTLGLAAPVVGQVAASLAGGFLAGYVAGGAVTRGGWNGLLAGLVAGLGFTLVLVGLSVGFDAFAGAESGGGVGSVLVVGVVSTVVFAIVSTATGMAGSWYRG